MRRYPGLPVLLLLSFTATGVFSQDRISPHADRETRKLEPIGVEALPAQVWVDAYTACLASSLVVSESGRVAPTSIERLRRTCAAERENLAAKLPQRALDEIDGVIVSRINEIAARSEEKNNDTLGR